MLLLLLLVVVGGTTRVGLVNTVVFDRGFGWVDKAGGGMVAVVATVAATPMVAAGGPTMTAAFVPPSVGTAVVGVPVVDWGMGAVVDVVVDVIVGTAMTVEEGTTIAEVEEEGGDAIVIRGAGGRLRAVVVGGGGGSVCGKEREWEGGGFISVISLTSVGLVSIWSKEESKRRCSLFVPFVPVWICRCFFVCLNLERRV